MTLVYYRKEEARWPALHGANGRLSEEEALIAVRKWCGKFGIDAPEIRFRGYGGSNANRFKMSLARESKTGCLDWLVVAHELAHCWDIQKFPNQRGRERDGSDIAVVYRRHDKHHAKLVDRLCRYAVNSGWTGGLIAHGIALKSERKSERAQAAARPPSTEVKIARREEQIARLDRRIKALTTRRQTAQRSLSALRRAQARRNG